MCFLDSEKNGPWHLIFSNHLGWGEFINTIPPTSLRVPAGYAAGKAPFTGTPRTVAPTSAIRILRWLTCSGRRSVYRSRIPSPECKSTLRREDASGSPVTAGILNLPREWRDNNNAGIFALTTRSISRKS